MKILIILTTILFSVTLSSQEISGTYIEGPDSLSFSDNKVIFSVRGNDALGAVFTGQGTYKIVDDFIIINTEIYEGAKTKIDTAPSEKQDTLQLQLFCEDGYSIQGVRAEFLNKKNKPIDLRISGDDGVILFKPNPKVTAIRVSDLLYDKTTFELEENTDYTIHLVKNRVLEGKTVIFKLIDKTDSELNVKLLTTDFNRDQPSASQLRRLEKNTKAIVDRTRSFKIPESTDFLDRSSFILQQ